MKTKSPGVAATTAAFAGLLALVSPAMASVTFDPATGTGSLARTTCRLTLPGTKRRSGGRLQVTHNGRTGTASAKVPAARWAGQRKNHHGCPARSNRFGSRGRHMAGSPQAALIKSCGYSPKFFRLKRHIPVLPAITWVWTLRPGAFSGLAHWRTSCRSLPHW
jgi:hypothetical protein